MIPQKIYSTISGISLAEGYELCPHTDLSDSFVDWIERNTINLMNNSTPAEKRFSQLLMQQPHEFQEQAFFFINGRSYFLDFFIPDFMIAIEVNGESHIKRDGYDYQRDCDFNSIGIKTIRLTNNDIFNADIKKQLNRVIRETLKGVYDASEYFLRPIANRFHREFTGNQKYLLAAISELKKIPDGSKVLLKSHSTYMVCAFNYSEEAAQKKANYKIIKMFHEVVRDKHLNVALKYTGDIGRVPYWFRDSITDAKYAELREEADIVIRITPELVQNYQPTEFEYKLLDGFSAI